VSRAAAGVWFWLAAAREPRTLLAPVTTLIAVELILFAGADAPAQVSVVTALAAGFPLLAWTARQVLDAPPDDQQRLVALALGSRGRAHACALVAAGAVVLGLAAGCLGWGAVRVDADGISAGELVVGAALAVATALAATAVGRLASRRFAGPGAASLVVLVVAPLLTAVLGASRSAAVWPLVPALGPALRRAYDGRLVEGGPRLVLQMVVWSVVVLALSQLRARRS